MHSSIPKPDLESLERHRAEASQYRQKIEQDIADGTDPYFSKWFGGALAFLCVFAACAAVLTA